MTHQQTAAIREAANYIISCMGMRINRKNNKGMYMESAEKTANEILRVLDEEEKQTPVEAFGTAMNDLQHAMQSLADLTGETVEVSFTIQPSPGCARRIEGGGE